jgi:hypothetical protein
MDKETYLGDGLYVSHDGWQICLRAPREEGDHVVYMDQSTWMALVDFMKNEIKLPK